MEALLETALEGLPKRSGKVRDVYDLGDRLLLVATDRISAFDRVLPNGIPDKGRVLTGISGFLVPPTLRVPEPPDLDRHRRRRPGPGRRRPRRTLDGRSMIVQKARVVPFECVVRGYLSGSGWKEYRSSGTVCGEPLPAGLSRPTGSNPIFTPATKAEIGPRRERPVRRGWPRPSATDLAERLEAAEHLDVYRRAAEPCLVEQRPDPRRHQVRVGPRRRDRRAHAGRRGPHPRQLPLLGRLDTTGPAARSRRSTSSSSATGSRPTGWDKQSPPPKLPDDVVAKTRREVHRRLRTPDRPAFPLEVRCSAT